MKGHRRSLRWILLLTGFLVGAVVLVSGVVDEGEVVTLTTVASDGARYETQLWIVEQPDGLYLRSGSPASRWLARLRAEPRITLRRGDRTEPFRAVPADGDPATLERVNRAMAEKYGDADAWVGRFADHRRSVAIRLEPRERDPAFDPPERSGPAGE